MQKAKHASVISSRYDPSSDSVSLFVCVMSLKLNLLLIGTSLFFAKRSTLPLHLQRRITWYYCRQSLHIGPLHPPSHANRTATRVRKRAEPYNE